MKEKIKILFININVLIIGIFVLNLLAIFLNGTYKLYSKEFGKQIDFDNSTLARYKLPNYEKYSWAKQYFIEEYNLKSEYIPFVEFKEKKTVGKTINIDSSGIRISTNHNKDAEVLFLGGSTMFGYGSNDENSIPSLFAKKTKMSVINYGNGGHNAFQGFIKLSNHLLNNKKPKIIISYDGVNELVNLQSKSLNFTHGYDFDFATKINSDKKKLSIKSYLSDMFKPIYDFTFLTLKKFNLIEVIPFFNRMDDLKDSAYRKTSNQLLTTWLFEKNIAESNNILFYCIIQPTLGTSLTKKDHLNVPDYSEVFEKFYSQIRLDIKNNPKFKTLQSNFIDLSSALDKDEYIYNDEWHVSPNGNNIIANSIINEIGLN